MRSGGQYVGELPLKRLSLLVAICCFTPVLAWGAPPVVVGDQIFIELGDQLSYLEDPEGVFKPDELLSLEGQRRFTRSEMQVPAFGFTDSVYWFVFRLENASIEELERLLEVGYSLLDQLDVYVVSDIDSEVKHTLVGDKFPFSSREVEHRNFVFSLNLKPGETTTVLMRVETTSSLQLPIALLSTLELARRGQRFNLGQGVYYGILLVMIVYNFFIFLSIRELAYFYYVCFVAWSFSFQASLHGFAYQYLWPESVHWNEVSIVFSMGILVAMGSLFCERVLSLPDHSRRLTWLVRATTSLGLLLAGASFFVPYRISVKLGAALVMANCILLFAAGIIRWRAGQREARKYTVAWSVFFIGTIVFALAKLGVLESSVFLEHSQQVGMAVLVVLLSLALAERLKILEDAKSSAERSLQETYMLLQTETKRRFDLQESNDTLQEEMGIAAEQLIQAEKLSGLGQMVAGILHEIGSPLAHAQNSAELMQPELEGVAGFLNGMLDDSPEAKVVKANLDERFTKIDGYRVGVLDSCEKVDDIKNSMRNYSRQDSERTPDQSLVAICDEVVHILNHKIKHLDVAVDVGAELELACQRSRLAQVLVNFLGNAADAVMEESEKSNRSDFSGRISLAASSKTHGGVEGIAIVIEDNGGGVPEALKNKIREAFFTTKAIGKGTGLGLAISSRIISEHGGHFDIGDSESLGGAKMTIWLPCEFTKPETLESLSMISQDAPEQERSLMEVVDV